MVATNSVVSSVQLILYANHFVKSIFSRPVNLRKTSIPKKKMMKSEIKAKIILTIDRVP
jgi:hypothetical protein